jgi:hypothetical protein
VGLDATGKVVIRKKCSRTQLLAFTANLQVDLIGMESCSGSHFPISVYQDLAERFYTFAGALLNSLSSQVMPERASDGALEQWVVT